jgi:hypothetical protein
MKPQAIYVAIAILLFGATAQGQWVQTNGPYGRLSNTTANVSRLASYPNGAGGSNLLAGCSPVLSSEWEGGVLFSTNNGTSWTDGGLWDIWVTCVSVNGICLFAGGEMPASTKNAWLFRTNNGMSWDLLLSGGGFINGYVAVAAIGTRVFASPGTFQNPVVVSTDNGTSWTPTNAPFRGFNQMVEMGSYLFAGACSGVFRSTDNGTNWSMVNTGIPVDQDGYAYVSCLAVLGPALFAGTPGGVFRSTNDGQSWSAAYNGLTDTSVSSFAVSGTSLFAGTSEGVFLSTNNGTSWTAVSANLPSTIVNDIVVSGTNLFAAVDNSGVWRRPLSEMITSVDVVTRDWPHEFLLHQNYPNPFNPSTTIRYGLPQRSNVTLAVYNTLGQQVTVLQNGEQEAGYHEVKFEASNLPSGVYFYRLQAGGFVQSRKFMLVR